MASQRQAIIFLGIRRKIKTCQEKGDKGIYGRDKSIYKGIKI